MTDITSDDVLLMGSSTTAGGESSSFSTVLVDRTQGDLSSYKKRIDANAEQQREHSDMMAGLQRKVEEYRRRIADIEGRIATQRTDESVTFNIGEVAEAWTPEVPVTQGGIDYDMSARFDAERRRNEELRFQNEQLQAEIQRIRQQFDLNMRDKERVYQNRERNLAQYLSEEQKRMMDLWSELQQVRRQCAEYKEQTERDLENQRNEFLKVMRSVGGIARQLNITSEHQILSENGTAGTVQDTMIAEALTRFREQQGAPGRVDAELNGELMKKYEEAIERVVELESRSDLSGAKVPALELDLRRTKDRLSECMEALRKIDTMAKENRNGDDKKRSRSLSPAGETVPAEVVRNVRASLRARDTELQQLQRKLRNTDVEIHELVIRVENAEEARKRLEKQLADSKKDIGVQLKALEEANREVRRLEERLRASESERAVTENARKHLEDEIRRLKLVFDQTAAEGERKAIENAEERYRLIEEEYQTRINELVRRVDGLLDDNKRLKGDNGDLREKFRNLETEHTTTLRKLDEKELALKTLDTTRRDLLRDLEDRRVRLDAVTNELESLQTTFSTTTRNTATIEMTVKEIKQQRDDIVTQKEDLERQLADLKHKMDADSKTREEIIKANQRNLGEIEKLKAECTDLESQLMMARRHNDEMDTQYKTGQAKITTLENSLTSAQKEINKLNDLNMKLQKEKNEIMNLKQRSDADLDQLRERIRKVEQEIEKLILENRALIDNEQKATDALKEETNRSHLLNRELLETKAELDELRRRLKQLDEESRDRIELALQTRRAPIDTTEVYETTQITEIRLKEADDKYKLALERLENERDELVRQLRQIEDEMSERDRTIERQRNEIDELKLQSQIEVDRLRAELAAMQIKYQNEMDDERDQYNHNLETMKAVEDDLRTKLATAEKKLEDAIELEKTLQHEIAEWEEKYGNVVKEVQKVREQIDVIREDADKEVQKWKTETYKAQNELKTAEANNDTLKSQLAAATERSNLLNRTINENAAKIRELNAHIRRLEEELADSEATVATHEADLERTLERLKNVEEQNGTLQMENNKLKGDIDSLQRQIDTLKNTNTLQSNELDRLKKKLQTIMENAKETADELERVRNERDHLDKAHRDKSKQLDQVKQTLQTLEAQARRLKQEAEDTREKLSASEADRNMLRSELKKLQQELQFGKEQMLRKTDEFHAALEDLANAHRTAEDGRVTALQELESRKFELSDLQSRLDNADQRLASLQQDYLNADKDRDMLSDSLRRFQNIIGRSAAIPIPEGGTIDVQSIDVHVQKLIARIDKLERERDEYRESLGRLKRKTSDSQIVINKQETIYKTVEERITDVEEGKRQAEMNLASAKELLRSQEDALRQRDDERRSMKSKIVTIELEARGKDAQIRHLNEQIKSLKKDLESAQHEVRTIRERDIHWDSSKVHMESKFREPDADAQRMRLLTATFENERQGLNDSLKKLTAKLQDSDSHNTTLSAEISRLKKELSDAERTESDLRRNLDEQTRIARDAQVLREQLLTLQGELSGANVRKQQLESELSSVRADLRDQKQHVRDAQTRISDLQRQLQDSQSEKNRLNDRLNGLEKNITQQRNIENDLRQQLTRGADERRTLQNEMEDLRRRIEHFEAERRNTHQKIEELTKIRIVLIQKVEILETEKRAAQAIITETASQREAIESSLNALERENKELCRNCAHLQQQIAQLEMDSGNRLVALTNKQKEEHERFVQSIKQEKAQVERIIENRDRVQKNRIKQLELQLNSLREQLAAERRRHRDTADRLMITDISKISAATYGHSASGLSSAGGFYAPAENLEYNLGSQSGFTNHYMRTPFLPTATGDYYRTSSAAVSLKEPADIAQTAQTSSSYRSIRDALADYRGDTTTGGGSTSLDPNAAAITESGSFYERQSYGQSSLRAQRKQVPNLYNFR